MQNSNVQATPFEIEAYAGDLPRESEYSNPKARATCQKAPQRKAPASIG
jgi:hypothetical protein